MKHNYLINILLKASCGCSSGSDALVHLNYALKLLRIQSLDLMPTSLIFCVLFFHAYKGSNQCIVQTLTAELMSC